ncbi:MAG: PTS sugar transporter subunit IIA [Streptococcaceae bacterium]|jgi:PTS system ascorbate-specific IIA component|nr:PTS sugar transporter subunit IIA [Streptococcaceae bacterium]
MLDYFKENNLVTLSEKTPKSWEEAVRISCENLLEKGIILEKYVDDIVACIKEHGPYIVLIPGVAMPHSTADHSGVLGTAISFTKFKENVYFEGDDEEKAANLFFTLAAKNPDEHIQNIANLSDMLMTEGLVEELQKIQTMEEYDVLIDKFENVTA